MVLHVSQTGKWKWWFLRWGGGTRVQGRKPSEQSESQQQTKPTCGTTWNWTQSTLVGSTTLSLLPKLIDGCWLMASISACNVAQTEDIGTKIKQVRTSTCK